MSIDASMRMIFPEPRAEMDENNQQWWTSIVEMNGKQMLFSISAGQAKTSEEAAQIMRGSLENVAELARELQLGEGGLQTLTITEKEVVGHWKQSGKEVTENVIEKFTAQRQSLNPATQNDGIIHLETKMQRIQEAISRLALHHLILSTAPPRVASAFTQSVTRVADSFEQALSKANQCEAHLLKTEQQKFHRMLEQFEDLNRALDALDADQSLSKEEKLENLKTLRELIQRQSFELKETFDTSQELFFSNLETNLVEMMRGYHGILEQKEGFLKERESVSRQREGAAQIRLEEIDLQIKELETVAGKMRDQIRAMNTKMEQKSLTTNTWTAAKSDVMNFAAVVERKMALLEKVNRSKGRMGEFSAKLALRSAPSAQEMEKMALEIQNDLYKVQIVDTETIKARHGLHFSSLKWGSSYLKTALTHSANWTEIQKAYVKESKSGKMYVHVTKNEPVGITLAGGVPSGMRKNKKYVEHATNLIRTTSYMRSTDIPGHYGELVTYRGAQFPTPQAALNALKVVLADKPEEFHINSLLTPSLHTWASPDKKLVITHKKNVLLAIKQLKEEAVNAGNEENKAFLNKIEKQMVLSNFGVNEWGAGERRFLGMRLGAIKFGWHFSIFRFGNEASQQLNASLNRKFARIDQEVIQGNIPIEDLDRLGALVQVGQEMEEVWAQNLYAEAQVGSSQFKMPVLWGVMDSLLGVRRYTNCMSGKDRTSKVEDSTREHMDEIHMSIYEQKKALKLRFDAFTAQIPEPRKAEWLAEERYLTSACFRERDLTQAYDEFVKAQPGAFSGFVKASIKNKIKIARQSLGIDQGGKFLEFKTKTSMLPNSLSTGTFGISTNVPKRQKAVEEGLSELFPALSHTSMFKVESTTWNAFSKMSLREKKQLQDRLANRQREAENSRLSQLSGSLEITAVNTSKPGFKMQGTPPFSRFASGFDRDYVLLQLLISKPDQGEFSKWVGLADLDPSSGQKVFKEIERVSREAQTVDDKIAGWTKVLKEIEKKKMKSLAPQAKVKF